MVDTVTVSQSENNPSLEQEAQQQEVNSQSKSEAQQTEIVSEETSSDRPEWLPEKFSSAEDLAKAYSELEKKFSSKGTEEKSKPEDLQIKPKEEVKEQTNTLDKFYNEYANQGSLSDNSYKELEKMGINKQLVDAYIVGQQSLQDQYTASVMSSVGGQENYNNMIQWASQNLSKSEIEAFNKTLDTGSLDQAQLAIAGINAKYQSNTREPNLFSGQKAESNLGYESVAEMLTDINNPKYQSDSAFRRKVEAKVKQSNVL